MKAEILHCLHAAKDQLLLPMVVVEAIIGAFNRRLTCHQSVVWCWAAEVNAQDAGEQHGGHRVSGTALFAALVANFQ